MPEWAWRGWHNGGSQHCPVWRSWEYLWQIETFVDDLEWSIVYVPEAYADENGETVQPETEIYDNSEYCVAGDITDHRDGTVSVKMGKPTDAELLAIIMGGA